MVISVLALVVMVAGLLVWAFASNAKMAEAGRLAYFAGLLALMLAAGQKTVTLGQLETPESSTAVVAFG